MMQMEGQQQSRDRDERNETLLRQMRFALVLSGDDQLAQNLVDRLTMAGAGSEGNNLSASARQFYQLQKLYELWMGEAQKTPGVPGIFQPGRTNEAIQKGLDPSIAKIMGGLPTLHRALLLLIYGEGFSYAATAQLLNITIEELMMALSAARQKFMGPGNGDVSVAPVTMSRPDNEVVHDTTR